jgi:hypothetical protein
MELPTPADADHGPENAEFELQKAFNCVVETGVTHFWDRKGIPGVNPDEVVSMYKRAFDLYRRDERLAAERWARTAKHLSRAFWHEAKLAYFQPRSTILPFLEQAAPEAYGLHEREETTRDLLDSVADHVPPGMSEMPPEMRRYLGRAREHLRRIEGDSEHELVHAEKIKAAHEYARVLECSALAYEAEARSQKAA